MLSNILDTVADALEQVWRGNFAGWANRARGQGGACQSARRGRGRGGEGAGRGRRQGQAQKSAEILAAFSS
jgi:hypothetical protein